MTDPSLAGLLDGYQVNKGRYDEMREPDGSPRPHWKPFLADLSARPGAEVSETLSMMERDIRENGVTYNVYADPLGADRPWEVDPVPLLLPPDEWAEIEAGIAQRAELLNRVLADIYGPQQLMRSGAIPPTLQALDRNGWIAPGAVICCEVAATEDIPPIDGCEPLDQRKYGAAKIVLLRRAS